MPEILEIASRLMGCEERERDVSYSLLGGSDSWDFVKNIIEKEIPNVPLLLFYRNRTPAVVMMPSDMGFFDDITTEILIVRLPSNNSVLIWDADSFLGVLFHENIAEYRENFEIEEMNGLHEAFRSIIYGSHISQCPPAIFSLDYFRRLDEKLHRQ